jgi:hypothetical protein
MRTTRWLTVSITRTSPPSKATCRASLKTLVFVNGGATGTAGIERSEV